MTATLSPEEVATSRVALLATMEQILREVEPTLQFQGPGSVSDFTVRRFFTSEQLHVADSLGWDNNTLRREVGRIHRVRRLEVEAGTQKDRDAARKAAEKAAKELDDRDDDILEIIRQKQAELNALTAKRDQTAAVVAKQDAAVAELRSAAPKHIQEQHLSRRREVYRHYQAMIDDHPGIPEDDREEVALERDVALAEADQLLDIYIR